MVAPDWLDRFPDESIKQRLFYRWFNESPSPALLRCLSWHLSSVEPLPGHHRSPTFSPSRGSLVLPLSANIAVEMLTHRFTESTGKDAVRDVLEQGLKSSAATEELAGLLAAVPDRVVLLPPTTCPALQSDAFIPFLTEQLVECVENDGRKYASLAAEVLFRAIQRGHGERVASTLAELTLFSSLDTNTTTSSSNSRKGEVVASIFAEFPASSALEKLLESILRVLPKTYTSMKNKNKEEESKEQDQMSIMDSCLFCLRTLLPVQLWQQHSDIRLLFQDKLLTQKILPTSCLNLLLAYLNSLNSESTTNETGTDDDILAAATWRVATQWGDKASILRLPPPQQAYMTCALVSSLKLLSKSRFEGYSGLLPALLRGISTRLDSPREPIRRQAMRVGKTMSQILDSSAPPLFGDENIDLLSEEYWEEVAVEEEEDGRGDGKDAKISREKKKKKRRNQTAALENINNKSKSTNTSTGDEDYPMTETDSDDDISTISSTDSEFERYDLEESDDEDVAKTNLQLRDLISLIQKSESDWKGHLRALRSAESLIRAAPDELVHYSVPLARALLLTTAPAWADEELPPGEDPIEDQRFRSLVALTAAAPEPVGLSLASEVYSPSLDVQQRSRALAVMAAAAQEISSPGSILKSLENSNNNGENEPSKSTQWYLQGEKVPGKAGRVVRASERSLEKSAAAARGEPTTPINKGNRFPPIALKWAAALLKEIDVRRHGVDLFGRDFFILGRVLATLGSFLEASQQSPQAASLATAVIELIKGHNVYDNEEPYVRRAALMAASHACMAVPPGAIATALLPSSLAVAAARSPSSSSQSASTALVERFEWLREWADETAEKDPDNSCRMMAAACRGLQGALSAEAMASLAASVSSSSEMNSGSGVILPSFSGNGSMPSVSVNLPRLETLNLK